METNDIYIVKQLVCKYGLNHVLSMILVVENQIAIEHHNKWVLELREEGKKAEQREYAELKTKLSSAYGKMVYADTDSVKEDPEK